MVSHGFLMVFPLRRCAFQPWCLTVMALSLASWRWSAVEAAENFCRHRPQREIMGYAWYYTINKYHFITNILLIP